MKRVLLSLFLISYSIVVAAPELSAQNLIDTTKNPFFDVTKAPFNAACNGLTDDSAAIQAAIDATDQNRGGVIYFPQSVGCFIAKGLVVTHPGSLLLGQGHPGISRDHGLGSSRIISANGITAITFQSRDGPGTHLTTGFMMRNLHIFAASGATTGNGVVVNNTETFYAENVTISDYIGGVGLLLDGKNGNAQYAQFYNVSIGDSLTGFKTQGTAPNGWRWFGGYFAGKGTVPRVGSIAIHITTGDTGRLYGTVVQGWETGAYIQTSAVDQEMVGPRFEYNNINLRIGSSARRFSLKGGVMVNSILMNTGAGNIGIQIDPGASHITLDPTFIGGTSTAILDNSRGGVQYPTYGSSAPF